MTAPHGNELWKTDGTAAGTVLVKDINPGGYSGYGGYYPDSSFPANLTNVGGTLFFTANDGINGAELWKSDGTTAGTVMVKDISPGAYYGLISSNPANLTNVGGKLFFSANDGNHRPELWKVRLRPRRFGGQQA